MRKIFSYFNSSYDKDNEQNGNGIIILAFIWL